MKIISFLITLFSFFLIISPATHAVQVKIIEESAQEQNSESIFSFFADHYKGKIPTTYKYISLDFKKVDTSAKLYEALQVLVYLDLIENTNQTIDPKGHMNRYVFFKLSEKIFDIKLSYNKDKVELLKESVTRNDFHKVNSFINETNITKNTLSLDSETEEIQLKNAIFNDVIKTISNEHYNNSDFSKSDLLDAAIIGVTSGTDDKHTVYFPAPESKSFKDALAGDYEGIGAYVDMEKPGELKIITPMPGSPAEKAGLKGGDIVTHVDGNKIEISNSLNEVITWIKGPKGTTVILTVVRGDKTLEIPVIREQITLNNIEEEKVNGSTYYIKIKTFGEHVSRDFKKSLETVKSEKNIKKIIIDLRNNGGGFLSEVTEMLSYLVPKDEQTAVIKYIDDEFVYKSKGNIILDLNDYEVIILQNTGTASASEILIGTLQDYFPEVITLGEKSYGKGSVQTIRPYKDGSTLKYTIAKWYTGKTETGIDGVGITPDIELEFDFEAYSEDNVDNQLNKAKSY